MRRGRPGRPVPNGVPWITAALRDPGYQPVAAHFHGAVDARTPAVRSGPPPTHHDPGLPKKSQRRKKRGSGLRNLIFKFRVSPDERTVIRDRARGYPSPAEFARRTLLAGWSLPVARITRVTDAFLPIQEVIEKARGCGLVSEADAATAALREILSAVTER